MSWILSASRIAARIVLVAGVATQLACSNSSTDTNAPTPPDPTTDGGGTQPPVIPEPVVSPARRGMVEIDQMTGTRPLKVQQQLSGNSVSLAGIYQQAGFPLRVVEDQ